MSLWDKFNYVIDIPFDYARKITLPPCEVDKYDKMWAMIFPIPGLLFIFFTVTLKPDWWYLYIGVPIGLAITLIIWKTSPEKQIPSYYILMELFGTIGALVWTYLVSGILIDLL